MKPYTIPLILSLIILLHTQQGMGQMAKPSVPQLDQKAPNFKLSVLEKGKLPGRAKTLSDYQGRWLILDFWTRSCSVCIQSMPKLDSLQKHFKETADFILIGKNDPKHNKGIESLYTRLSAQGKFSLDVAFDTTTFKTYGVRFTPHVAIISPDGILRAVTYGSELNKQSLEKLFSGTNAMAPLYPSVVPKTTAAPLKPPVRTLKDSTSINPHHSVLAPWKVGEPIGSAPELSRKIKGNTIVITCISLSRLYQLAYLGKTLWDTSDSLYFSTWAKPIIQMQNPAQFESNTKTGIGAYSYKLTLQKSSPTILDFQLAMQADLKEWFGHKAFFKEKEMPVYALRTMEGHPKEKLKSQSDSSSIKGDYSGYSLRKVTAKQLIGFIYRYHRKVYIDETDLDFPIDINLATNVTNFAQLKNALKVTGLELDETRMLMKVLVLENRQ